MAILSTSERKCLLVAAVHSAPVRDVAWRLKEDFLLVSCTDGKLYVWQIETGTTLNVHNIIECHRLWSLSLLPSPFFSPFSHPPGSLDRCVDGETAKIVFSHAQETTKAPPSSSVAPLQVRSLKAGENDSLIQVCQRQNTTSRH